MDGIGTKSKVESRKSKVESRKSKVESRKSKVESRKSKVESRKSKVRIIDQVYELILKVNFFRRAFDFSLLTFDFIDFEIADIMIYIFA
jgi:hypothetical protein